VRGQGRSSALNVDGRVAVPSVPELVQAPAADANAPTDVRKMSKKDHEAQKRAVLTAFRRGMGGESFAVRIVILHVRGVQVHTGDQSKGQDANSGPQEETMAINKTVLAAAVCCTGVLSLSAKTVGGFSPERQNLQRAPRR